MHRLVQGIVEAPVGNGGSGAESQQRSASSWGQTALGVLLAAGGGGWLIATVAPAWPGWLVLGVGVGLLAGKLKGSD